MSYRGASTLRGPLHFNGTTSPGVSSAGEGRIYFDSGSNVFKASENGGAYVDLTNPTSGGGWTDDGTVVRLTTSTDQVGVGTTTPSATAKMEIDASSGAFADGLKVSNGSITCPGAGANSERFGNGASVTGVQSTAIGSNASALAGCLAVGFGTVTSGLGSSCAVGSIASATGGSSLAVGNAATAAGNSSVALGPSASTTVGGTSGTALGNSASVSANASIAIGISSSANVANTLVAGSSSSPINDVYFGKGISNATPTAYTIHGTGGTGAGVAGAVLSLAGGVSGDAATAGGVINFKTARAGTGTVLSTDWMITAPGVLQAGTGLPSAAQVLGPSDKDFVMKSTNNWDFEIGASDGVGSPSTAAFVDIHGGTADGGAGHFGGEIIFYGGDGVGGFGGDVEVVPGPRVGGVGTSGRFLVTGSTRTTAAAGFDFSETWSNGAVAFTAIKLNVTDTASTAASLLLDLKVGGASKFTVDKSGNTAVLGKLTVTGAIDPTSISFTGAAASIFINSVTSTAAVGAAGEGRIRFVTGTGWQVSSDGGAYATLATGTATLQASYAAGNTIAATAARPIAFSNAVDATNLLTLTRTFAGGGNGLRLDMDAVTTGTGFAVTNAGTGASILVDQSGAGVQPALQVQTSGSAASASLTNSGANNTHTLIVFKTPAAAQGGNGLDVTMGGGGGATSGDGVRIAMSTNQTGSAIGIIGGSQATSAPVFTATQTWNAGGVTFVGQFLNVTDTASAAASLLADWQVGGTSRFKVNKTGSVTVNATNAAPAISVTGQYYSAQFTCTVTLDWNNGNAQAITLANGGQTFTFANGQAGGRYLLKLKQPAAGAAGTVTWPGSVLWSGGTAPTLTATNGQTDIVTLYFDGTNFFGGYTLNY